MCQFVLHITNMHVDKTTDFHAHITRHSTESSWSGRMLGDRCIASWWLRVDMRLPQTAMALHEVQQCNITELQEEVIYELMHTGSSSNCCNLDWGDRFICHFFSNLASKRVNALDTFGSCMEVRQSSYKKFKIRPYVNCITRYFQFLPHLGGQIERSKSDRLVNHACLVTQPSLHKKLSIHHSSI